MNNKFKPDDVVSYLPRGKHNGEVLFIFCDNCPSCSSKQYEQCRSPEKNKVMVRWQTGDVEKPTSRFKYKYTDLEYTHIAMPTPSLRRSINGMKEYKGFPTDPRKLGTAAFELSLIEEEEVLPLIAKAPVILNKEVSDEDDKELDEFADWARTLYS